MITRTCYDAKSIRFENGETAILLYYLTGEIARGLPSYGAEIVMHCGKLRKSAFARDVTGSAVRMAEILGRLCSGCVCPDALQEIICSETLKKG